jgi:replicative DNA helicase
MHDERAKINYILDEEIKMQKELGFVLINLSQISRSVETRGGTKKPMMSDLKESGKIEESSRKIIMLYRPEVYGILEDENGESLKDVLEMIVVKNNNGRTGTAVFKNINMACNKIYNPETPDEDIDAFNTDLANNNFSFPRTEITDDMPF